MFTMTGADPCTDWLGGLVALDDTSSIKTGLELSPDDLAVGGLASRPSSRIFSRRAPPASSPWATSVPAA